METKEKIMPVCKYCGSKEITGTTNTQFNPYSQKWECDPEGPDFEVYCRDCESEADTFDIVPLIN